MRLSEEVRRLLMRAIAFARENRYVYVTPETVLLALLDDDDFREAAEFCGADTEDIRRELLEYLDQYVDRGNGSDPELSGQVSEMLSAAWQSAYGSGNHAIKTRHLVRGMWKLENSYAVYFMKKQEIAEEELLEELSASEDEDEERFEGGPGEYGEDRQEDDGEDEDERVSGWRLYAPCLNETLTDANPLIGRESELERTIQVLCRRDKNNPLHIGEPGVGKTAITYGLVQKLRRGEVPEAMRDARVFALDLGGMLAGTRYRGDFEKRFKKVLMEIAKEAQPIIFIDEIHNLAGAGAVGEGSFDASNLLKPYLSEGHIRFIGATTYEEYKKYFEKNKSLVRRFQNIEIKEPTVEETVRILEGLRERYETFHGVVYGDGVLEHAVRMSAKYMNERFLPDKAIDIIDEAGAYRKLHPTGRKVQVVDRGLIDEILTGICRIPVETVKTDDVKGLATLEKRLSGKIFGQQEAIRQVTNAVKFSKAGLSAENKPLASLLFVGPTGVGKTEVARTLAAELGVPLIRFDMSEYGEKHSVAKLIGSPAGYVGYEEGGILTEAIRKNPSAVLLLDEIEKAHPDIYHVLLQVMDYATLTDNQGRKADFRNVILIMTSNAGASRIGKPRIGFENEGAPRDDTALMEEVRRIFQPEFRNRLDKIVAFNSMDEAMAEQIVDKKLGELREQLKKRKIAFTADRKAKKLIREKGISPEFGAREVDRVIRGEVKALFVDEMLFGKLKDGGKLKLTVKDGAFAAVPGGR